jgi:tRNA acetyltransferase TAN1
MSKRKAPAGGGGGGGKRNKALWRKQAGLGSHRPVQQLCINDGLRGVLFTCHTHRARAAAGEAFEILRHVLAELGAGSGAAAGEADDDDAFDAELAALRTERLQLCEVDTGIKGCVLIVLKDAGAPEPDAVVAKLFEELKSKSLPPVREVIRASPLAITCKGRLPEIIKTLTPLLEPHFGPSAPPTRWNIVFKKRATDPAVVSRDWTVSLAALVDERHPVDLKDPEVSVLVDVFRASCGLCVSRNYHRLHQYNCQHKAMQPDGGLALAAAEAKAKAKGESRRAAEAAGAAAGGADDRGSGYVRAEGDSSEVDASRVETLLKQRTVARSAKDWSAADSLLAQLHEMGVDVTDKPDPTDGTRRWCGGKSVEDLRRGDWTCPNPSCGINCFASKTACYTCHTPKPQAAAS